MSSMTGGQTGSRALNDRRHAAQTSSLSSRPASPLRSSAAQAHFQNRLRDRRAFTVRRLCRPEPAIASRTLSSFEGPKGHQVFMADVSDHLGDGLLHRGELAGELGAAAVPLLGVVLPERDEFLDGLEPVRLGRPGVRDSSEPIRSRWYRVEASGVPYSPRDKRCDPFGMLEW